MFCVKHWRHLYQAIVSSYLKWQYYICHQCCKNQTQPPRGSASCLELFWLEFAGIFSFLPKRSALRLLSRPRGTLHGLDIALLFTTDLDDCSSAESLLICHQSKSGLLKEGSQFRALMYQPYFICVYFVQGNNFKHSTVFIIFLCKHKSRYDHAYALHLVV